mgnify:CR=1 FL=1
MLNNKSILITGGTGSFGKEFVKMIYEKFMHAWNTHDIAGYFLCH